MPGVAPRKLEDDEPLSASWLNSLVDFIAQNQVSLAPDSGLTGSFGAAGWTIGLQETPDIWIKITYSHADGSYSWIEAVPNGTGGFSNGFRKGYCEADPARNAPADPAWEANLNSSVPVPYYVRAYRDPAVGRLSFRAGNCSS